MDLVLNNLQRLFNVIKPKQPTNHQKNNFNAIKMLVKILISFNEYILIKFVLSYKTF